MLSHDALCARLPHGPAMCLLDRLDAWDASDIHCATRTHRATDNPLRDGDVLPILAGIEIAAQAMALHIGLLAATAPRRGYLAAVRDLHWSRPRLDDVEDALDVHAHRLGGDDHGAIYTFTLKHGADALLRGRATVMFVDHGG